MEKLKPAIIDIGSNTFRLVMYQNDKDEGLHEFGNIKTVARLRTYLLPSGEMDEEGIRKLSETLVSFKQILEDYNVTDIEMPQMDGHHLTRKIKEHEDLKKLPVIIFSSLITDALRHKGENVGAEDQISKPEIAELILRMDQLLL